MNLEYYIATALPDMLSGLFSSVFGLAVYVFLSLGLYTIAKRRGLNNPWLAWLPLGNMWILGSLSDQYQYSVKNKKTNRRKILLWLEIIAVILAVVLVILLVAMVFTAFRVGGSRGTEHIAYAGVLGLVLVMLLMALIVVALAVVYTVFQYIALHDLYVSCVPENATLFLVLSIFFSFLSSIFVFVCRDKDDGMRQPQPVTQQPYYQTYQTYQPQQPVNPESAQKVQPVQEVPLEEQE